MPPKVGAMMNFAVEGTDRDGFFPLRNTASAGPRCPLRRRARAGSLVTEGALSVPAATNLRISLQGVGH
eukprot:6064677-Pleurochrysis_carterae.AAC.1